MSYEPPPYDLERTRREHDGVLAYDVNAEADFLGSGRRGRPDRPHVVSMQWANDVDAERLKYDKTKGQRGLPRRLYILLLSVLSLAALFLWKQTGRAAEATEQGDKVQQIPEPNISPIVNGKLPINSALWRERSGAVVEAFRHAWKGYEQYAWGYDELRPITHTHSTWMDVGMTIIDALDTAWIMGQKDIFDKAVKWVTNDLKFNHDGDSNVFELTIRVLGGLLSAYHFSGEQYTALLQRATELADILLIAFNTSTHIPLASINFATRAARAADNGMGPESTSEAGTLGMEFKYLSHLTGDVKYWNAVQGVGRVLKKMHKVDGLVPIYVDARTAQWSGNEVRLGSRGDSYYEYLGKQYLLSNESGYLDEYRTAVLGIRKHLLGISSPNELFFVGELPGGVSATHHPTSKMDHLVCFLPGTLAVTATRGKKVTSMEERSKMQEVDRMDLELAEELGRSCWEMYRQTATGLAPEIVYWRTAAADDKTPEPTLAQQELQRHRKGPTNKPSPSRVTRYINGTLRTDIPITSVPLHLSSIRPTIPEGVEQDFDIHSLDAHNLLRPETIESFFVLWRVTGDIKWREWGWEMFQAFEKWCKVDGGGYTSLNNVRTLPPSPRDKMETFFLGETLKYFYLLFADEENLDGGINRFVPLDKYVFNTEAHPFPTFDGAVVGTPL